jgi:hypothetical protein
MQSRSKRCGAKNRNGAACHNWALPSGRCRMHGGKSLSGIASPRLSSGKYSTALPVRLAAKYEEARTDPDLLALREEVGLLDTRLLDLISRVDTGESGAIWEALQDAYADLQAAQRIKDATIRGVKLSEALGVIGELIMRGHTDYAAWNEIGQMLEARRKLVESERRRLVEMQQMVTTERAMVLLAAVVGIIKEHITDRAQLSAISNGITNLITIGATDERAAS